MNRWSLTSSKTDGAIKILKDDSMTFAEKAISLKSRKSFQNNKQNETAAKLSTAGDIEVVSVDLAMAQDRYWASCDTLSK